MNKSKLAGMLAVYGSINRKHKTGLFIKFCIEEEFGKSIEKLREIVLDNLDEETMHDAAKDLISIVVSSPSHSIEFPTQDIIARIKAYAASSNNRPSTITSDEEKTGTVESRSTNRTSEESIEEVGS